VLARHVFHFGPAGDLYIGKLSDPAGLGHKVTKINGKDVRKWLKKKDLQKELAKAREKAGLKIETGEGKEFWLGKSE